MGIHGKKRKKKSEMNGVSVAGLIRSLDKLRWDHPITMKAFRVAGEIQKWIDSTVADENRPFVAIVVASPIVSIAVGDCCVWDSESCSEDNLNFQFCREEYREHVLNIAAVFEL